MNVPVLRSGIKKHWGALNEVAKEAGVTPEYVRLVLKGQRTSVRVLNAAASILVRYEESELNTRLQIQTKIETAQKMAAQAR